MKKYPLIMLILLLPIYAYSAPLCSENGNTPPCDEARGITMKRVRNANGTKTSTFGQRIHIHHPTAGFVEPVADWGTQDGEGSDIAEYLPVKVMLVADNTTYCASRPGNQGCIVYAKHDGSGAFAWQVPQRVAKLAGGGSFQIGTTTITGTLGPGGFEIAAAVNSGLGNQTWTWNYEKYGDATDFTLDANGWLENNIARLPPPTIYTADGQELVQTWTVVGPGQIRFTFNDSGLAQGAYPYVIR